MRSIVSRAGSTCIYLFAAGIVPSVVASLAVFASEPAAEEPLVLELELSAGAAELHQEIVVAEESDFRVVTQSGGLRWSIEGSVGRIVDGIAPVKLAYGTYASPTSNHSSMSLAPYQLAVDRYGTVNGGGTTHLMMGGLWLRRGLDAVPVLARSIAARHEHYANAVYRLGELGPKAKPAVPELIAVLNDAAVDHGRRPYESVRGMAAGALGKIGPEASAAAESLLKATGDDNPYLRLDAALALWKIAGQPAAVATAVRILEDQDHFVRGRAATTLGEMGAETADALQSLVTALADEDRYVRTNAALALWNIRRDPLALSCLRDLSQNDPEEKIRRYAARLLYNMENEQSGDEP